MRLDKFLKVSRLIKRRTVANEACEQGKIKVNGKVAKPAADVKEGDILELTFGERTIRAKVLKIADHTLKEDASELYQILS